MKSYYYADSNNIQQGPFDLDELKQKPITRNTLVWHSGLDQWTLASGVKELEDFFANTPPVLNPTPDHSALPGAGNPAMGGLPPRTWLVESILVMICCFPPLGLVGLIYAAGVEQKWRRGLYAQALHDSNEAGKWTKIGFWIGIAGYILSMLFFGLLPFIGFSVPIFTLMHFPIWNG